jgi:small-conductance mechanosensitive channel
MRIQINLIDKKIVFTAILALLVLNICQSQTVINLAEQDLRTTPIDSINFDKIRLSKVLGKSSEDIFILLKLAEDQLDTTTVQALNIRRKERIDAYTFFTQDKVSRDLTNLSNRELHNLDRQWTFQKNEIESIITDYLAAIDRFDGEKKSIEIIDEFWKKYREHNKKLKDNDVLVEDLKNINNQISMLRPAFDNKVDIISEHVNSLNKINIEINDKLGRIKGYFSSPNNLFKQNVNPYWSSFKSIDLAVIGDSLLATLKSLFFDLKETSKNFVSTHILVVLLFFLFYFRTYRIKKRLQTQTNYIENHALNLNTVFDKPIRAAYFYTFIFAYYIYLGLAPAIFLDIISLVAVIVLFSLSKNIFGKVVVNFIKQFIIFWISVKIVDILTAPSLISRTILLFSSVYFLFWLLRFHEKKELEKYIKNTIIARKLLDYYLKLVVVCTVISIICTVFGYMNLALYTSGLIVKITLLVVFLYLWNPLLKRFFLLFLDESYLKSRKIICDNKEAILKTTFRIINILTYAVFIDSFLTLMSFIKPFTDWFVSTINNEISIGSLTFSLWSIALFVIIIIISTFLSKVIQVFLQEEVLVKTDLERGFPETISMLVKYLIVGIGYFVAITSLGFEMSQLTIIFGALSVGIGFGLQNIFNNLVSGLILIFSRPIRIDDTIEINSMVGTVNSIGIRSSNVRTFDGAEVIIPNGNLISNEVINWTLSDQRRRILVMVGVAYGSDVRQVSDLLKAILQENNQVMKLPEPMILFDEFADSSLNFKLLFWTENIADWMRVKSNVLFEINDAFTKENIEIPFPQRDIHMRS